MLRYFKKKGNDNLIQHTYTHEKKTKEEKIKFKGRKREFSVYI